MQELTKKVVPDLELKVSSYHYDDFLSGVRASVIVPFAVVVGGVVEIIESDIFGRATGVCDPNFCARPSLFFEVVHVVLACAGMAGGYRLLTIRKFGVIENDYSEKV